MNYSSLLNSSLLWQGAPTALLYVTLFADGTDVSATPAGNLFGTTETYAVAGKAHFDDIKITKSNLQYRLRFLAQASTFLSGGLSSNYVIHADSEPFTVVNGPPAKIRLVTSPGIATDAEVLTVQPAVGVLDAGDNQLRSDCFDECGGILTESCSATEANNKPECAPMVTAELVGVKAPTTFGGTLTSVASAGVARFTDLRIDSGALQGSACMCPQVDLCAMCYCNAEGMCEQGVCNLPPPFPDYNIRVRLVGAPSTFIDVPVTLQRRVSNIVIEEQPTVAVAGESFQSDVVVKVVDCTGSIWLPALC